MHLVSCKHRISGLTDLMNRATRSMRRRTELIFQVVRERRIRTGETGCVKDDACLRPAIKVEFSDPPLNSGLFEAIRFEDQPGGKVRSVISILNMPGSIFLDVSRL